jgi:hypothetical protein
VYVLNALYLAPITIWTYLKYGRPEKPGKTAKGIGTESTQEPEVGETPDKHHDMNGHEHVKMEEGMGDMYHGSPHEVLEGKINAADGEAGMHRHANHDMAGMDNMNHVTKEQDTSLQKEQQAQVMPSMHHDMSHMNHGAMHNMHMPSPDQPMFPTVTIAVCHCGAGCLLGDIIGEWLVFDTNAIINGRSIGPEFLIGNLNPLPLKLCLQINH